MKCRGDDRILSRRPFAGPRDQGIHPLTAIAYSSDDRRYSRDSTRIVRFAINTDLNMRPTAALVADRSEFFAQHPGPASKTAPTFEFIAKPRRGRRRTHARTGAVQFVGERSRRISRAASYVGERPALCLEADALIRSRRGVQSSAVISSRKRCCREEGGGYLTVALAPLAATEGHFECASTRAYTRGRSRSTTSFPVCSA